MNLNTVIAVLFVATLPSLAGAQDHAISFNNPLDVAFGDPYVIYDDASARYYMYGTGGGAKNGFAA